MMPCYGTRFEPINGDELIGKAYASRVHCANFGRPPSSALAKREYEPPKTSFAPHRSTTSLTTKSLCIFNGRGLDA
jgi:hypothetical protein